MQLLKFFSASFEILQASVWLVSGRCQNLYSLLSYLESLAYGLWSSVFLLEFSIFSAIQ